MNKRDEENQGLIGMCIVFILSVVCAMMLLALTYAAEASTPTDADADLAYCKTEVAEQMATLRRETAENDLARAAINGVTSALLGSPVDRVAITTARTGAYGQINRSRTAAAQRRMLEQQCMMERKRGR